MSLMALHCPECHDERLFERPHDAASCPDRANSPDGCCPELVCIDCGAALLLGFAAPSWAARWGTAADGTDRPASPERAA